MNEAAFTVQDGLAEPKGDQIFRECFGHKMGPLETAAVGIDTVVYSLNCCMNSFGTKVRVLI